MTRAATAVICTLLASEAVTTASRFDWGNYDSSKAVVVAGTLWSAENLDGYVVIRINRNADRWPTDNWVVVMGTPQELRAAGMEVAINLGIPAEAIVWLRKDGTPKSGRAQEISLHTGPRIRLRAH